MKGVARWPEFLIVGSGGIPDSRCRRRGHEPFPKSGARAQMASADIVGFHRVPQTELLPKAEANDPRRKFRRTQHGDPTPIEACSSGRFSRGGGRQALWVLLLRHAFTHRAALDGATVRQGPQTPLPSSRPGGLEAAGYWLVAVVAAIFAEYGRGSLSARQSRWLFFVYEGIFVSQSTRLAIAALALGAAAMGLLRWTGTRSADEYGRGHSWRRDDHVLS